MADFPNSIATPRTVENIDGVTYDADQTTRIYAEDINNANAEIVAIEDTLGVDPQGDDDTVVERLDRIEEEKAPLLFPVETYTTAANRNITSADNGLFLRWNNGEYTPVLPANSSIPIPVGFNIRIQRLTSTSLEISVGGGVTIQAKSSHTAIASQYGVVNIVKVDTDVWSMSGDTGSPPPP